MNYKHVLKWLPSSIAVGIIATLFISSLSGIWLAEMFGYISEFSADDGKQKLYWFIILFMSGLLFFFFNSVLSKYLRAASIRILNKKMKITFIEENFFRIDEEKEKSPEQQVSKIINDFKLIEENYFSILFDTIGYLIMSLASITYLLHLNVLLGILFAISSFLSFLPPFIGENYMVKLTEKWTKSSSILLQKLSDLFQGLLAIKTYQVKEKFYYRILKDLKNNEIDNRNLSYSYVALSLLAEASSTIGEMFPFAIALYFVYLGEIEVGIIISMHYASDRVAFPLRFSAQNVSKINSTKEIRKDLGEILDGSEQRAFMPFRTLQKPTIHLNNVTIGHHQDKPLLKKVNLKINYGAKVLITGKSGVGKSTFFDALQGQSVIQSGEIIYKSEEQVIDAKQVYHSNLIARVHQNTFMYSETLAYNITLGKEYKRKRLIDIVKKVGLYDELGSDCLDKTYGEEGSELSGGQKQRVEIARALFHRKKILLVDEATAALDEGTAKKVRDILYSLPQTVIEVAHHFNEPEKNYIDLKHFNIEDSKLHKKDIDK